LKLLFLDMDGVLNNLPFQHEHPFLQWDETIDPKNIDRLERVLKATGALIVISSAWRHEHDATSMQEILRKFGASSANVIGVTPSLGWDYPRAAEIGLFLETLFIENIPVEAVAAVDDMAIFEWDESMFSTSQLQDALSNAMAGNEDALPDVSAMERLPQEAFVRTKMATGLTDEDADKLIAILGRKS
jgi:hypothetical protein